MKPYAWSVSQTRSLIQGSLSYQPKHCANIFAKSLKISIRTLNCMKLDPLQNGSHWITPYLHIHSTIIWRCISHWKKGGPWTNPKAPHKVPYYPPKFNSKIPWKNRCVGRQAIPFGAVFATFQGQTLLSNIAKKTNLHWPFTALIIGLQVRQALIRRFITSITLVGCEPGMAHPRSSKVVGSGECIHINGNVWQWYVQVIDLLTVTF